MNTSPSGLSQFGQAYGRYMAAKSPLGAALYAGITGHMPGQDNGAANDPANTMSGRYGRNANTNPNQTTPTNVQPTQPQQGPPTPNSTPKLTDPISQDSKQTQQAFSFGDGAIPSISLGRAGNGGYSSPGGTYPSNPGDPGNPGPFGNYPVGFPNVYTSIGGPSDPNDPGTGSSSSVSYPNPGDPGYIPDPNEVPTPTGPGQGDPDQNGDGSVINWEDGLALGGVASHPMTARIAESGPEMAGGRIISSPSIVKLNKGEAVIPLTARPNNKLQPDLLEGHLAAPKPPGEQFTRFKSYGTGRGLMR